VSGAGDTPVDGAAVDDVGIERIAVVGLACRFPGAADPEAFWHNLRQGVESVRFFSEKELEEAGVDPELIRRPDYVKAKAVLDDVELFDASFFGVSPRVAELTDPQQRIFLECAWQALEHAGHDPRREPGAIGVFGGVGVGRYLFANYAANLDVLGAAGTLQTLIGNRTDHLTTSVAYRLGLEGPAVTVQTTCSTSLVAVHLACQSLLNYQCDVALAGGVSVEVPQKEGYLWAEGGIASPDGHCRPFDARAGGIVSGSGAGIVVLRRLSEALADGDTIHAVIRGSAINNDGSNKVGYTAPSIDGQAQVIAMAQAIAGVRPEEVGYVEAHGTATPMGDPIEVAALRKVFGAKKAGGPRCALGSVKSNFGHLDTAAGIAGLIKTVLALEHRELPPSLHFERPNPALGIDETPFHVNAELAHWRAAGARPRIAGVSSFGIGGTNAHVVLEEPPAAEPSGPSRPWQLLLLSARTGTALEAATERLRHFLEESSPEENPGVELADVAFTLQAGRRPFEHRRAVVCRDVADAVARLGNLDPTRVHTSLREPREQPVLFLFPGQGAQHPGMGAELYRTEAEFRRCVDRCSEILEPHLGLDLRRLLFTGADATDGAATDADAIADEAADRLRQTALAQPALFVVEYALARLWGSWGVEPEAMIGHSIGEYVAACLAGVFSLEDALGVVAARGRMIQELPGGAMLAVQLPEGEVRERLGDHLDLAAVNRPSQCVVSGPAEAVERLHRELAAEEVVCHPLHTSHAFHSRMMEPILRAFEERMGELRLSPPSLPYLSNVTGGWITAEEATDPGYWARHLRSTVRFSAGVETLLREHEGISLEVGPGTTLRTLVRKHPARPAGHQVFSSLPHPREREPETAVLAGTLGRLWLAGTEVDWNGFYAAERRRRLPLPTYPFERRRYWLDAGGAAAGAALGAAASARRPDPADWFYVPTWHRSTPAEGLAAAAPEPGGRWLVLGGDGALGGELVGRLGELSQEVVRVARGDGFARVAEGVYTADPARRADFEELLADLRGRGWTPGRIVHLWSVSEPGERPGDGAGGDRSREQLDFGFHSLLALAQALGKAGASAGAPSADAGAEGGDAEPLRVDVVSSNMQEVVGGELLWPEKAALLGPCRTLPKESAGVGCRSVDLDLAGVEAGGPGWRRVVEQLVTELVAAPPEPVVAYRGHHRWLPGFDPVRLGPVDGEPSEARLRPDGCYLVTGGLGGMGLALAEHLARTVKAKLVLVGRSELPPRERWEEWLGSHPDDPRAAAKVRRVLELEELGAEVLAASADVADEAAMARVLADARERFGELHGVVHAAGISPGGLLQLESPEAAAETLRPKVAGTRVLARLLAGTPLDFFVLCSSRSAFLAPPGSVSYTAANAFLDAFAHGGAPAGWGLTLSIGWCAWREVGMLAEVASAGAGGHVEEGGAEEVGAEEGGVEEEGGEEIDYPLFDRRWVGPEGESYLGVYSVAGRWVLDEHRIAGVPVIPGTTYLEMARAALEMRGADGPLEIHDVYFLTPVGVREDEEREVRLEVEPEADGFDFRVSSRGRKAGVDGWRQNVLGKLRPLADPPRRRHDVAEIIARCRRDELIASVEDEQREDLGPRWHAVQQVHVGDGEVLAALELPVEFAGDLERLKLHPALLDRSASLGEQYLVADKRGAYLPMSYQSLRIAAPLPRKVYSWARLRGDGFTGSRRETFSFDVDIMDEDGTVLVEIENFSKKLIHDPDEQLRAPGTGAPRPAPGSEEPGGERYRRVLSRGVSPAEGVEAFRRLLGHRPPPRVVVSPTDLGSVVREAEAVTLFGMEEAAVREAAEAAGDAAAGGETGAARRARHARPDLPTPYLAPRNDREERLAALWREMFGIGEIGVHDNFFQLGGDSVLGVRIVAKARQSGMEITPNQLFEHQTIAELAELIDSADSAVIGTGEGGDGAAPAATPDAEHDAEAAEASGPVPLTPIQHDFLQRPFSHPHHWNFTELFEVHGEVDRGLIAAALRTLVRRHDALRLRFHRGPEGWRQLAVGAVAGDGVGDGDGDPRLSSIDLSAVPEKRRQGALEVAAAQLQGSLHLSRGPLLRLAFFDLGSERSDRMLIVAHHLIVDVLSMEVLIEDLQVAFLQLAQRQPVRFPRRSAPFRAWAERLLRHADSPEIRSEAEYWLGLPWERTGPLPADHPEGENSSRSGRTVKLALEPEESELVLGPLPRFFGVDVRELLLTGITRALAEWTGRSEQLIVLTGHGRDPIFDQLDVARTVGWFVVNYPVVLSLDGAGDPVAALRAVSSQLRRIPGNGLGYGVLRHLVRDPEIAARMRALPGAEVAFNYKGHYRSQGPSPADGDGASGAGTGADAGRDRAFFRPAREDPGPFSHPAHPRPSVLHVSGRADDNRLELAWRYSENRHRRATIERVADATRATLRSLIAVYRRAADGSETASSETASSETASPETRSE